MRCSGQAAARNGPGRVRWPRSNRCALASGCGTRRNHNYIPANVSPTQLRYTLPTNKLHTDAPWDGLSSPSPAPCAFARPRFLTRCMHVAHARGRVTRTLAGCMLRGNRGDVPGTGCWSATEPCPVSPCCHVKAERLSRSRRGSSGSSAAVVMVAPSRACTCRSCMPALACCRARQVQNHPCRELPASTCLHQQQQLPTPAATAACECGHSSTMACSFMQSSLRERSG